MTAGPTPPLLDRLRACAAQGMSQAEAARRLGIGHPTVSLYAARHAIPFPKATRITRARYAACAADGLTQAETARRLGVTPTAVGRAARRYGLAFARKNWRAVRLGLSVEQYPLYRLARRKDFPRREAIRFAGGEP